MAYTTVQTGNSAPANVRATKSTSSALVGTISNGTTVNVVRCDATWSTLQLNGTPAFVWNSLLTSEPTQNGAGLSTASGMNTAKCNGSDVNVRANAVSGSVVRTLNKGDGVSILASTTGSDNYVWYRIATNQWVRGDFLAPGGSGGSTGGTNLPNDVTGTQTTGFVDTKNDPLNMRSANAGGGSLVVKIPRHASIQYYTTTNSSYHYVVYGSYKGYASAQYIMRGTWVDYTGSDPIEKIKAHSKSYKYSTKHIKASIYLANLDVWARKTNYGYPTNHNNAGHYPSENPPKICCAYMPYLARNSLGYNNCPSQKSTSDGSLIGGTVTALGGMDKLLPGMELFQGTTHMGVYAGKKTFPSSGSQHAVYQSVAGALGSVIQMYTPDTNSGPNLTTMNSSQGWPDWSWPKDVILDNP